jgi:hypothetical protein
MTYCISDWIARRIFCGSRFSARTAGLRPLLLPIHLWGVQRVQRTRRFVLPRLKLAMLLVFTTVSACSPPPPIISGDTSCERFRHISATPAQIKVFSDNWEVMETYADQIVSHNLEYDRHCLGVAP